MDKYILIKEVIAFKVAKVAMPPKASFDIIEIEHLLFMPDDNSGGVLISKEFITSNKLNDVTKIIGHYYVMDNGNNYIVPADEFEKNFKLKQ